MNGVSSLNESTVEDAALAYLKSLGWGIAHGPDIAPDTPGAERTDYGDVVLTRRLQDALVRLNSDLPTGALDDAFRRLTRLEGTSLESRNRAFHRLVVDGVNVEYRDSGGVVRGAQVKVIDFDDSSNNDWLAVNQFTVTENKNTRRPDVVLFVNGLPLGIIELKNPVDEDATIWTAWQQLQTYKGELPTLFAMNAALMVSDGMEARVGTLTAGREWFKPWRTISGEDLADPNMPELQVMLEGVCDVGRFLSLVRDFIVFEDDGSGALAKKMAGYHQFHAVRVAVGETRRAVELQHAGRGGAEGGGRYESGQQPGGAPGDQRIGVVWHTQGSGKSLTMAFYAGAIVRDPVMENPTIVVLTDRNDLDDQLFGTFSRCRDLLRQTPTQASNRADLRRKLSVASDEVTDIFAAAGLDKPDISVLSDEFLDEVRGMPQRNLAVELLEKLLKGEISSRMRKNVVQARSFADMLEQTILRYQNRTIEAAYIIDELIKLGQDMREAQARGESLGMMEEELAFYDALETNDSAVQVLGDETLRTIARELVRTVRENVTIDWTLRENVRANLRRLVKRILRKHGYPPDKADGATLTVLEQAEMLSEGWAVG